MYSRYFREGILKPDVSPPIATTVEEPILRSMNETPRGWALRLQNAKGLVATVQLDDVLRPIFARRVSAAFDMVLIADEKGDILYSLRTPPSASSLLGNEDEPLDDDEKGLSPRTASLIRAANRARKERESGTALVITRLGALMERKGWREYTALNPAMLLVATEQTRVRLGDAEYLLFTQPYTFAHKPVSLENRAKPLIICGLVAAPRFRYAVSAVSASVAIVAVGVVLLAFCCWPFLRIALIHPSQELMITDVVLIVICTAVGACVLTLAILDVFAYRALAERADKQLRDFSEIVVTDFGNNVKRAMKVLERAQTMPLPPLPANKAERISRPLPPLLMAPENIGDYPYIDAIAWIDPAGKQQFRFVAALNDQNADAAQSLIPLFDVGQRQYFRDALLERTWTIDHQPYVLEWVRSRATGEVRAVLAKNTHRPDLPVITLSTDLIDVTYAVRPPGVQLAIIEENGEVLYHSDTERIGYENFFAETDRNRDLRSAVLARQESPVAASYWGEDQSMYVRPLTGSRWTLITFRAKRLSRVLNVEAALLTLVLLLLAAGPYVFLYILTIIIAPGYRAPSIWPDESRRGDYLRLCIIYLSLLLLFGLTTYVLTPWSSFYAVILIPAIAILSTYLVLHRVAVLRRFAIAAALWIVANAILFTVLLRYDVAAGRFFSGHPTAAKVVLVAVAVVVAALTAMLISTSGGRRLVMFVLSRQPLGYATLYRLCGVLILILCTALPVAAFFNISRRVQSELLVKYGQLRAAADLEQRIDRLETLNVRNDSTSAVFGDVSRPDILRKMFGSRWELQPPLGKARAPGVACDSQTNAADWTAKLLPALYEDSTAIHPLFATGATDELWRWCMEKERITLERKVRFDVDVSKKLWPSASTPPDQKIIISSLRRPADDAGGGGSVLAAMLLGGLGILAVF